MGFYDAPKSSLVGGNSETARRGLLPSLICSAIAVFVLSYKYIFLMLYPVSHFSMSVVLVMGIVILLATILGLITGIVGLVQYFKYRNKRVLVFSSMGLVVLLTIFGIGIYNALANVRAFYQAQSQHPPQ